MKKIKESNRQVSSAINNLMKNNLLKWVRWANNKFRIKNKLNKLKWICWGIIMVFIKIMRLFNRLIRFKRIIWFRNKTKKKFKRKKIIKSKTMKTLTIYYLFTAKTNLQTLRKKIKFTNMIKTIKTWLNMMKNKMISLINLLTVQEQIKLIKKDL